MTKQTSPFHHFANAYAGLLQQLSGVEQVAALDAYKADVVGQDTAAIANLQYQEITTQKGREFFEELFSKSYAKKLVETNNKVTPAIWENAAQQVAQLNETLSQFDAAQKVEFLTAQGVDVTADNLAQTLNPKVAEILTNPTPALEIAQSLVPTPEVQGEQAPADEPHHKHDLQDSVVNFVSTLLTSAKGEECTITREEAAKLIADYPEKFSGHSEEHYTHVLMESVGNFKEYSATDKTKLFQLAIRQYLDANHATMTPEQIGRAQEQLDNGGAGLDGQEIIGMLDTLMSIPSIKFIGSLRNIDEVVNETLDNTAEKTTCFTEKIKAEDVETEVKKTEAEIKKPSEELPLKAAHRASDEPKSKGAKEISLAERVKSEKEAAARKAASPSVA